MPYAEEYDPKSDIGTTPWAATLFEKYDYTYDDVQIANKLLSGDLTDLDDEESAIHRLAIVSSVSGSVFARATLAQYGGINFREAWLYKGAVNSSIERFEDIEAHDEILRRARSANNSGDYLTYIALSAVIGLYPPEYGDSLPCLDNPSLDPYYDTKHDFREGPDTQLIGMPGNSG